MNSGIGCFFFVYVDLSVMLDLSCNYCPG